jgi:hypothetical protein
MAEDAGGYTFVDPATLAAVATAAPMQANATPPPAAAPAPGPQTGGYEFVDSSKLAPATAGDRVQAGEAGVLRGGAYLAGLIPDTAVNAYNLGKAAIGTGYHLATGNPIPESLEVNSGPSPVGAWLTRQLDKSPITTTQVVRPDDATSRYLSTATSVVPAVLTGTEGAVVPTALNAGKAAVPAMAGQYVAEQRPFGDNDTANNAASVLAQSLLGYPASKTSAGRAPTPKNATLQAAQDVGYVVPPAATNPTLVNSMIDQAAGKGTLQSHASIHNQAVTDNFGRTDLNLPGQGPVTPAEITQVRQNANAAYTAIRNGGTLTADSQFGPQLDNAVKTFSGAGNLSAALGKNDLEPVIADLKNAKTFNSGDALDAVTRLRDQSRQAYNAGDAGNGAAYRGVADAIENQIDRSLSAQGQSGLVSDYRDARRTLAVAHTVEDAQVPGSYNLDAQKLARALQQGQPLSGGLRTAAESASIAPQSFAVPKASPTGGSHGFGPLATLFAAHEVAGLLPGEMGHAAGWVVPATFLGMKAGRLGAQQFALRSPGQSTGFEQNPSQLNAAQLAAQLTSQPATRQ